MKNIIAVTSRYSLGATFVDWSIYYLSGKTEFYNYKSNSYIPVCSDPLTNLNAHNHKKNHPNGFFNFQQLINTFINHPSGDFFTAYPTQSRISNFDISSTQLSSDQWQDICDQRLDDYNQIFNFCYEKSIKLIYIDIDPDMALYNLTVRQLDRTPFEDRPAVDTNDIKSQVDYKFFSDSIQTWDNFELTEIWDKRERLALCSRPLQLDVGTPNSNLNLSGPHLWIDSRDLWHNGRSIIKKIFNYAGLTIDQSRWTKWCSIYSQWQDKQLKSIEFSFNYQHILDAILNNWYYEIDLTFDEEVVIQHCLIYRYGLNLRTWGLTKFPSNTQELHLLLEPNIHPLS